MIGASPIDRSQTHWIRSPITTRHSQTTLLIVSVAWGLSYAMPNALRVPFSEVFPPDLEKFSFIPMWGWGTAMLTGALIALLGERAIMDNEGYSKMGWLCSFMAHGLLCAVYATLSVAALYVGLSQASGVAVQLPGVQSIAHWTAAGIISALSRPVLWGYISYLHLTYARLPRPDLPKKPRKRKRRLRMVYDDE